MDLLEEIQPWQANVSVGHRLVLLMKALSRFNGVSLFYKGYNCVSLSCCVNMSRVSKCIPRHASVTCVPRHEICVSFT